jgi:hypothetical protein
MYLFFKKKHGAQISKTIIKIDTRIKPPSPAIINT